MSKTVWIILTMGLVTMLALSMAMMVSLNQFQEAPAVEWVKLAEATTNEFKFDQVHVRVNMLVSPTLLKVTYTTKANSQFDSSAQNVEMENVAKFAMENFKSRDLKKIDQVEITRSEVHGSGCFQTTYVANRSYPNSKRQTTTFTPNPTFNPKDPPNEER